MWHGWGLLEVLQKDKGLIGLFVNSPICVFPLKKKKSQSYFSHYLYRSTAISKNVVGEILSVCFCKIKCLSLRNAKMQGRRENIFIVLVWTSVSTNCFLKLFFILVGETTFILIVHSYEPFRFFIDGFCREVMIKLVYLRRYLPLNHTACFFPSNIFCLCVSLGKMLKDLYAMCFRWWDIEGVGKSEVRVQGTQPTTLIYL